MKSVFLVVAALALSHAALGADRASVSASSPARQLSRIADVEGSSQNIRIETA